MSRWWTYNLAEGAKGPWTDDDIVRFAKNGYLRQTDKIRMDGQIEWWPAVDIVDHIQHLAHGTATRVELPIAESAKTESTVEATNVYRIPCQVRDALHECFKSLYSRKAGLLSFLSEHGIDVRPLIPKLHAAGISDVARVAVEMIERHANAAALTNTVLLALLRIEDDPKMHTNKAIDLVAATRVLNALRRAHRDARAEQLKPRLNQIGIEEARKVAEMKRKILLGDLTNLAVAVPKDMTPQQRGYRFEKLLQSTFELENIETNGPTRTATQQHDNRIAFQGENYLVEAKWRQQPTGTHDANHFHTKVDGVLYGRGLLFSMSGYATGVVADLTRGKSIKLILFDHLDVATVLEARITFTEMLTKKILAAQTRGQIYFDALTDAEKTN